MEGPKPYPTTLEGMKVLMVDFKASGVMATTAATKNKKDQGVAFAETQEGIKTATCFGCGLRGHLFENCKKTFEKERQKVWDNKEFDDAASAIASTKKKTKKTTGVINQAVEEVTFWSFRAVSQ